MKQKLNNHVDISGIGYCKCRHSYYDDMMTIYCIIIDGVPYVTGTDPEDGYRSVGFFCTFEKLRAEYDYKDWAHGLKLEDFQMTTFKPQRTKVKYTQEKRGNQVIIDKLTLTDIHTGKVVLESGTDFTDDYYPYAIFEWHPENMEINQGK